MKASCDRCKTITELWTWVHRLRMMVCYNCHLAVEIENELAFIGKLLPEYIVHEKHEKI